MLSPAIWSSGTQSTSVDSSLDRGVPPVGRPRKQTENSCRTSPSPERDDVVRVREDPDQPVHADGQARLFRGLPDCRSSGHCSSSAPSQAGCWGLLGSGTAPAPPPLILASHTDMPRAGVDFARQGSGRGRLPDSREGRDSFSNSGSAQQTALPALTGWSSGRPARSSGDRHCAGSPHRSSKSEGLASPPAPGTGRRGRRVALRSVLR